MKQKLIMQKFFLINLVCLSHIIFSQNSTNPSSTINLKSPALEKYHFTDFEKSMYTSFRFKKYFQRIIKKEKKEAQFIEYLKSRYNFLLNNIETLCSESPIIPKIIHHIWLGPKPLPKKYHKLRQTWIKLHPNWTYKLWTNDDIEELDLVNKEFFDKTPSWAEKANILRYEILFRFGGLYLDTDYKCFKSLNFLHHCCDFYAGLEYPPTEYNAFIVGNALIGAKPGHPILAALIEGVKINWHTYSTWTRINQLERSGTRHFTRTIKNLIETCDGFNVIFPSNVFFPFGSKNTPREAIGFHYWDATWVPKKLEFLDDGIMEF